MSASGRERSATWHSGATGALGQFSEYSYLAMHFRTTNQGVVGSNPAGRANSLKWLRAMRTTTYRLVGTFPARLCSVDVRLRPKAVFRGSREELFLTTVRRRQTLSQRCRPST